MEATTLPSTSFFCSRLNSSTFLIIEDDSFGEEPHIYVKVYREVLLISDTGCNSPRHQKNLTLASLRRYLETFPIPSNNKEPLNPDGKKDYLILCTHCHYGREACTSNDNHSYTDRNQIILVASNSSQMLNPQS